MTDSPRRRRVPSAASTADGEAVVAAKPAAVRKKPAAKPRGKVVASAEEDEAQEQPQEESSAAEPSEDELGEIDELGDESDGAEAGTAKAIVPAGARLPAPDRETRDLLQRYMSEVSRYPLLTRDDELSISREYVRTGDPQLAFRLITANLRLVVKIAWEYRRAAFNMLDLIQEGNVGLMQGVKKYDPERNVKLSSYAAWWIRAYIIRYLMDNWRMVKIGTTQAQRKMFFNLRKEKERLAAQGFEPEARLLAERLQVTEQDVTEMDQRLAGDEFSLDAPAAGETDAGSSYASRLAAHGPGADDQLAEAQVADLFRERLAAFGTTLKDKELFIFQKRLTAEEPLTLQQVGDHYGLTRERARQLEARLVQKLKAYMAEHLPDYAELSLEAHEE